MKGKKVLSAFLLAGILAVTMATTALAETPVGSFTGTRNGNSYTLSITNNTSTPRYSSLTLNYYDSYWKNPRTVKSSFTVLQKSGSGKNRNSFEANTTELHVRGASEIYNGNVPQSGVALPFTKILRSGN